MRFDPFSKSDHPSPWVVASGRLAKIRPLDVFVLVNGSLFLSMCAFVYYNRFIQYRGAANINEFFVYAVGIFAAICFLWVYFRDYELRPELLLLVQIGILLHFAGAFVQVEHHRLYDEYFLGLRYDKYVHFANALIAALLVWRLCVIRGISVRGINSLLVVLSVLGLGALIEIVEYLVVMTVERNGVGGYDNNMQDLIANFLGASLGVLYLNLRYGAKKPKLAYLE